MISLTLESILFLAGTYVLHLHGMPLLGSVVIMALLYFASSWLFRLAGVVAVVALLAFHAG